MAVGVRLRSAFASDTGRRRTNNEDRYYVDPDIGVFAVIDGVGGHAAGEHAAETAVEVMRERFSRPTGTPEERIREAITLANNEIYRLSKSRTDWAGMACVLTVALIEDDIVTVGHVGDSRLYLLQPGIITKITHDHSPVGEREDRGELTEFEAMRHSRRNEIYRDVGSGERVPEDPAFIQIATFPMPDDGALLLCSDGLSDLIAKDEIRAGLERYAPDFDAALAALIDAANHAGGKDNITIVVVAAPEYKPLPPDTAPTAAMSRQPKSYSWAFALLGLLIGGALGFAGARYWHQFTPPTGPVTIVVGPAGINAALNLAHPGDTVAIPRGEYKERVRLKEGVTLRAQQPEAVVIVSPDNGPAIVADKIASGSLFDVWLQDGGISLRDASPTIVNTRITGASIGINIAGHSEPSISACRIEKSLEAGIFVGEGAKPRIERNTIATNGSGQPGPAKPGVEVAEGARPVLKDNVIVDNASDPIWIHGHGYQPADFDENLFGELTPKGAIHQVDLPVLGVHKKEEAVHKTEEVHKTEAVHKTEEVHKK
jgi:serine/threonine protein phosphatase PrpC